MSPNFNWQTEDEDGPALAAAPDSQPHGRAYQRWLLLPLIAILLAGGGWLAWGQVQRQVDVVDSGAQAELIANHRLVETAARQQDAELLNVFLSGRDWEWTNAQLALVEAGLFIDRTPFGLTAVADNFGEPEVALSPRMTAAEIVVTRPYLTDDNETVYLRQTAVYRRSSSSQWLYAPPLDDFWGEREEIHLPRLTVTFPARDRAVAERLAADLERIVGDLCRAAPELNCLPGFRLTLNLTTDPASLTILAQPAARLSAAQTISLPTPTLVGLPVDDAAYRALYRGYAAQLLSPAVSYLFDWECCLHHLYYMAALDWQLDKMDTQAWPLADADYARLLEQGPQLETLRALWYLPVGQQIAEADAQAIYALVEFIFSQYGGDTGWAERQLAIPRVINFRDWLLLNHPDFLNVPEIEAEWYAYMADRAMMAQTNPPLALPDEALYTACHRVRRPVNLNGQIEPAMGEISLLRHDFGAQTVTAVFHQEVQPSASVTFSLLQPLGDGGLQFAYSLFTGPEYNSYVWAWQDETLRALWPPPQPSTQWGDVSFAGLDPDGERLMLVSFADAVEITPGTEQPGMAASGTPRLLLVDAAECERGDCAGTPLPGWPFWSPDGRHAIIMSVESVAEPGDTPIFLATADGDVSAELGAGTFPIWLDNETAAVPRNEPEPYLDILDWDSLTLRPLFPIADLLAALPEPIVWNESYRLGIFADPLNAERWYIFGSGGYWGIQQPASRQLFIVAYNLADGRFESLYYDGNSLMAFNGAAVAANGRYLSAALQTTPLPMIGAGAAVKIIDAASGGLIKTLRSAYTTSDGRNLWSSDGRWAAVIQDRALVLYAPEYDYQYLVGLRDPGCQLAAWGR
jgi:hypothetical protein